VLPLHHTHGLVTALIAPLRGGACIVFEPRFEARSVWDAFSNRQITAFTAVPTVYSKLLRAWQEADLATRERWSAGAARLRLMVSGSAALSPPLFEAWYTITGHRLLERYGMTEIGMALSNPLTGERRPGTVGFPLPGVRVCRVDEQGREVLEPSVPGELWIAGDSVFLEYWRKPDATRAALSSAPLAPPPSAPPPSVTGQETLKEIMKNPALEKKNAPKQIADVEKSKPAPLKWFRTGDLAVVEEGFFRLLGRMSVDILKTGGYKVSAIEIEEAIRRIEGVEDCAVVGVADPEWGQKVACALVLSRPEEPALALERVRAEASRSLAPYKVPRLWRLVRELPRNAMGKVQKPGLAELFREASGPLGAVSGAWLAAVLSGLALSLARPALATVDEGTVPKSAEERALELEALFWDPVGEQPLFFGAPESNAPALPAAEAFRRSRAILNYYSAAEEPDPSGALAPLSGLQTEAGIRRLIGFLDFRAPQWNRFFSLGPTEWLSFQDRDAKGVADHAVRLAPPRGQSLPLDRWSGNGSEDDSFEDSRLLRAAQAGSPDRPLAGIRIAIDPGHMGGEPWDERTGKFVRDAKTGRRLSEGILNLQTALLLEARLQALGAQVFLTRRTLIPVTSLDYESFALGEFARKELRQSSLQDWFQRTLAVAPPGERLRRAFDAHPEVRKLFSEFSRSKYFISRADLEARADAIDAFDPDIALFIHYDTTSPSNDPTGTSPRNHNDTKAYVPGAFDPTEFASREDRAYFARHALQGSYWWQSVRLSEKIVRSLSSGLGIPLARFGGEIVKPVVPGVFSRNLALTRRVPGRVSSFLECMFYNTQEFPKLYAARHPLLIDGRNYPYSDRLLEVVQGIQTGVVDYVRSLAAPPSRRQ
jgi:N-acetylmuramoyl-L-alanine amidase